MQTVNFEGLAQASAALVVWPITDEAGGQIATISAAKLRLGSLELTIGAGLTYAAGEVRADLTNARTANLIGAVPYELWIQIGADKLAVVDGVINFKPTIARI